MIDDSGQVSFTIVPAVGGELFLYKIKPDPLVQISCTGDATSIGFAAGETRHNSALTMSMKFVSQDVKETSEGKTIETIIENSNGIKARHVVIAPHACRSVRVFTEVINNSEKEITIEALSSVNISALTPYTEDEG